MRSISAVFFSHKEQKRFKSFHCVAVSLFGKDVRKIENWKRAPNFLLFYQSKQQCLEIYQRSVGNVTFLAPQMKFYDCAQNSL